MHSLEGQVHKDRFLFFSIEVWSLLVKCPVSSMRRHYVLNLCSEGKRAVGAIEGAEGLKPINVKKSAIGKAIDNKKDARRGSLAAVRRARACWTSCESPGPSTCPRNACAELQIKRAGLIKAV